jgi:hypothetical protein
MILESYLTQLHKVTVHIGTYFPMKTPVAESLSRKLHNLVTAIAEPTALRPAEFQICSVLFSDIRRYENLIIGVSV